MHFSRQLEVDISNDFTESLLKMTLIIKEICV